jgi:hypothetical protein
MQGKVDDTGDSRKILIHGEQKAKPKHFHFEESEPLKLVSQEGSR